jgi:hypothetical protein
VIHAGTITGRTDHHPDWVLIAGLILFAIRIARPSVCRGRTAQHPLTASFVIFLLLVVPHRISELVVVLGDEVDIALVLDGRRRRLQRIV